MSASPISTALLSYGMSGVVFHAPLLKSNPSFDLQVVVQRGEPTANMRWPEIKIVKSIDDVLSDPAIELVVVNTPNDTHYDYTLRCLRSGKHVVVEKPFTVTTREADELIRVSKEVKRVLTVFQNRRWDGDSLTLQKIVRARQVGKIAELELHYDRFRNYIEPNTWKEQRTPGTGILYNLGSHMLDQVVHLFGLPQEVDARIGIQREGGQVDDFYDIRLRFDGFYAIVKSSYLVREPGPRMILHGSEGSFVKFGLDPQEQDLKDGKLPLDIEWGKDHRDNWGLLNTIHGKQHIETERGDYPAFYHNVYSAIREGNELAVKPEQSRDVIRIIEACYESNRQRRAIPIESTPTS